MKSFEKLKTAHEIKHLDTSKFSQLLSFQFKAIGYTNQVVKEILFNRQKW